MVVKIELYIKNEEVITGETIIGHPISDGAMTHWCTAKETLKTQKVMPQADKVALEVANEFAKENRLRIEVYDITSFKGKLKATRRGVKTTPTLILDNQKIEGEQTPESLRNMLKTCLNKIQV